MAEKSNFFDSVGGDRAYYAADFAKKFATFFSNGVFDNGLQVISNNDMTISVKQGDANINGYGYSNDANKKIHITNADGVLNRIDNIVIRLDLINRQITAEVVTGNFAENAVAPQLTRGTNIYDLRVAKIKIPAGTTAITTDLIEDTRWSKEDCGNVICAVQTPNFSNIQDAYIAVWEKMIQTQTDDFKEWFESTKALLSGNVAGNLLNQIEETNNTITKLKTDIVASNAGAHNAIYRGKDITNLFYDGTLSSQIEEGTFNDIFIGDYIIGKQSGRKYLVADINYRLNKGMVITSTPHILMIPETIMGSEKLGNVANKGYLGCTELFELGEFEEYKTIIKNDFGTNHILTHKNCFTTERDESNDNGITWIDTDIDLMNERMVYGSNAFANANTGEQDFTIDTTQLALFRFRPDLIVAEFNGIRKSWWLRDVADVMAFATVNTWGLSTCMSPTSSNGIRPAFLVY